MDLRHNTVVIQDLAETANISELLAEFERPLNAFYLTPRVGYSSARHMTAFCPRWIWTQWLLAAPAELIAEKVRLTVNRGIQLHSWAKSEYRRGLHDLFLLNCALYTLPLTELRTVAETLCEASGEEENDGEVLARAWCGTLKYKLLGNNPQSLVQYKHLVAAYNPHARTGTKEYLRVLIREDWNKLPALQNKDFARMWARAHRNGIVSGKFPDRQQVIVRINGIPIEQFWCWSQVGVALLAYRLGASVATDPLWFPAHALACLKA